MSAEPDHAAQPCGTLGPAPEDTTALRRYLTEFQDRCQVFGQGLDGTPPPASLPFRATSIVGESDAVCRLVQQIRQTAVASLSVLVTGETGTGKELVARAIHGEGPRSGAPFTTVNCAALPGELLEAELFGHRAGAFTGATKDAPGLLATAHGGTFFLDEVSELPLGLQAKLLRVLDHGRFRGVGSTEETTVDVRVIAASNRDLREWSKDGGFRQDLFFRISALQIHVPPLRERVEDVLLLVEYFRSLCTDPESAPVFEGAALRLMAKYPWPGNIRELLNVVTRLVLSCSGSVRQDDVQRLLRESSAPGLFSPSFLRSRPLAELLTELERSHLVQLHADHGGNLKAVAGAMGISLQALYKKLRTLGLSPKELRNR